MASKYSISTIFKAIDKFSDPTKRMQAAGKEFSGALRRDFTKAQRQVDNFGRNFKSTMHSALQIGTGLAIAGMGLAINKGIELASDLTEVQNVVDTTFQKSSEQINSWSETALNAFGLSELQAKQFTGTLGAMLKSSGISSKKLVEMSTNLAGLTGDFASFYNLDHELAFTKIRAGISGETEPLKQIGINMSVANLEAFALSKGITKTFKSMSQAEQVQLRYNYLISVSKDAQGDFAKTLETSWANQKRILQTKFLQILAKSMQKLLPLLIKGARYLNSLIDKVDPEKLGNNILFAANVLIKFAKGLGIAFKFIKPFLPIIIGAVAAWKAYQLSLIIAAAAQWAMNAAMTANPIGLIVVGIGALIAAIILLVIHWKAVVQWLKEAWLWTVKIYDKFKGLIIIFAGFLTPLLMTVEAIRSLVVNWRMVIDAFKTGGILSGIMAIGKAILAGIISPIESLFNLLSKIPGVGKFFGKASIGLGNFKEGLLKADAPISQQERAAYISKETTNKSELTIKDQTGRAEVTKKPDNDYFKMQFARSGAF